MLTHKQRALLLFIQGHIEREGIAPTQQEMADGVGLRARSGINTMLNRMAERGAIRIEREKMRGVVVIKPVEPNGQG